MGLSLYEKVFDRHVVAKLPSGQYQLLIGLHLIHEVTSPQAFSMLDGRGLEVLIPSARSPRSTTSFRRRASFARTPTRSPKR